MIFSTLRPVRIARARADQLGASEERRIGPDPEMVGNQDEAQEDGDGQEAPATEVGHPEHVLGGLEDESQRPAPQQCHA